MSLILAFCPEGRCSVASEISLMGHRTRGRTRETQAHILLLVKRFTNHTSVAQGGSPFAPVHVDRRQRQALKCSPVANRTTHVPAVERGGPRGPALPGRRPAVGIAAPSGAGVGQVLDLAGAAPFLALRDSSVAPLARPGTPGAWYRGLHLVAFIGSSLNLPDEARNREAFPQAPMPETLDAVRPIRFVRVTGTGPGASRVWNGFAARWHYLGYTPLVGAQMRPATPASDGRRRSGSGTSSA